MHKTFAGGCWPSLISSSSSGARQLKFLAVATSRLNIFAVQNQRLATPVSTSKLPPLRDTQQAFILQSLADDSAYPRGPRGHVEAMNVTPIDRKSNKDLAAQLARQLRCQDEAQVMGLAGDPISRPAKTQANLASPGRASTVPVSLTSIPSTRQLPAEVVIFRD